MRLRLDALPALSDSVRRPHYDIPHLKCGIVHLGLGAFHRAHQAVFTEDAIQECGGDWGVVGVSMRKPDVARAVSEQDGLFTVETLETSPTYRVVGVVRRAFCLPREAEAVLDTLADPDTHVVTITVTESGYHLVNDRLDWSHPDIVHDLEGPDAPRSAVGVLVAALARRHTRGGAPLTIISCDNLARNGPLLREAVKSFAENRGRHLSAWIDSHVSFPESVVDCIVPAPTDESRARTDLALGLRDAASVQREPFAQWTIENNFVSPHPDWSKVGVDFVESCADHRRLKLHVLNLAHSALAYLGLPRGHNFVHEAARDPFLAQFLEQMMATEIVAALPDLDVAAYWKTTLQRFRNPAIKHRLDQIAQDGAEKLFQRYSPLILANFQAGLPYSRMAAVYAAWLAYMKMSSGKVFGDLETLPDPVWRIPELRRAIASSAT